MGPRETASRPCGRPARTKVASWRVSSARSPRRCCGRQAAAALPLGFALRDFCDADREQGALTQELANVARRVALEHTLLLTAAGVQRYMFKGTHGVPSQLRA